MNKLSAVIFDADGTIFDTFEMIVSAYRHVSETHGLRVPEPSEIRNRLGSPMHEMFAAFYPGQNIDQLIATNNEYVMANAMSSEAFAGIKELLEELVARSIRLAILTSGNSNIHTILRQHELEHYFDSVVHIEKVQQPKPHPEGFLLACDECGVAPGETVIVGDTVFDIQTGKNAGALATIAVTHGFGGRDDLSSAEPDYMAKSLADVGRILADMH